MTFKYLYYAFKISFFAVIIFIFSSCITSKRINYLQEPSGQIPTYADTIGYEEYTLAPYDKLYIRIYSADEATNMLINGRNNMGMMLGGNSAMTDLYSYTVDKKGYIKIPIGGRIKLAGFYIRDAKKIIETALKKEMKDDCAIDVRLLDRNFSVIGGGINGTFSIEKEKMNIFQALALAGDIDILGDRSKVKILRDSPNGPTIKTFDVRSKDIINSEFYYIQPNDVIYIQELSSKFFSVTNIGNAFSTFFTTASFGMLVYNLVTTKKEEPKPTVTNQE